MIEWLIGQGPTSVYIGLFLLLMSGVCGFPPEDLTVILGGIAASRTEARLDIIFLICYVGTVGGDILIYLIGRFFAKTLRRFKWVDSRLKQEKVDSIRASLEKRSLLMIFVARHLFYFRTLTFLVCGMVRMNLARFIITDALAALISVPFMLSIGFWAAEHYEKIWSVLENANQWLAIIILTIGLIVFKFWLVKRKQLKADAEL